MTGVLPAAAPRGAFRTPRRVLVTVAVAACVPYLALKVAWLSGSTVGIPAGSALRHEDPRLATVNALTVAMDAAVVVLAVALTRPWGRRLPGWVLVGPAWLASGLLGPVFVVWPVQTLLSAVFPGPALVARQVPWLDPWVFVLVYGGFLVQGVALGALFVLYVRERWGAPPAGRPVRPGVRRVAVAGVVAAVLPAVAHVAWACGATTGLAPGRIAGRGRDVAVLEAGYAVFVVAGAVGVVWTVFRCGDGRRAVPWVALAWCGTGTTAAWGGWLLLGGVGPGRRRRVGLWGDDTGVRGADGRRGAARRSPARGTRGAPGVTALLGRRARLRWVHLILGGALLMPYYLVAEVVLRTAGFRGGSPVVEPFVAFGVALPLVALTALFPVVRALEGAAARALCGADGITAGPARSWAARGRTCAWFVLHAGVGALVSGATLAVPPAVVVLSAMAVLPDRRRWPVPWTPAALSGRAWLAGCLALALLALLVVAAAGAGALLARLAQVLLGPTAAERLADAERRAVRLAARNRLARELHDSVGHALSAVTLQATAAGRLLERDPAYVRRALTAIEETTRRAVAELDDVLGVLREDGEAVAVAGPDLAALPELLERTAAAGLRLRSALPPGLDRLPPAVSREAYRIVQEGLSNALRHAGRVPVRLRITAGNGELGIEMTNPVPGNVPAGRRTGGGRGLRGVAERVAVLGGHLAAGADEDGWRLAVRLPVRGAAR
ncbi:MULTISPECIES: sensor histidine kinase [Streptomycetaceae]|nr:MULTISPECIES: histidine kinase [Streptomycetaceae]CCB77593.1 Histidine kinase (modular protein) [Streptantibioticus cattleyicolor NRRL 8057 = DSM 46488]